MQSLMTTQRWLLLSLSLNILFLSVIAFLAFANERSGFGQPAFDLQTLQPTTASEAGGMFSALRAAGIDESSAKIMVAARIEAGEPPQGPSSYWKLKSRAADEMRLAEMKREQRRRDIVMAAFGNDVQADPAFAALFTPYGQEFAFLPPHKQVELQKIDLLVLEESLEAPGSGQPTDPGSLAHRRLGRIQQLLTPEEQFEFEIRTSFTAQQLLSTDFDFTEAEFRAVYKVIKTDPSLIARLRNGLQKGQETAVADLRAALSPERFEEFLRLQDPDYRLLQSLARAHGVRKDALESAYGVIRSSREQVQRLRTSPMSTQQHSAYAAITGARDRQLASLLGANASTEFSNARSRSQQMPARAVVMGGRSLQLQ